MNVKIYIPISYMFMVTLLFSCASESSYADQSTFSEATITEAEPLELKENTPPTLSSNLSTNQLEAFQLRAIQKYRDYIDYIQLISDSTVEKSMSNHAEQLMPQLFIEDSLAFADSSILMLQHPAIYIQSISFEKPISQDSINNFMGIIQVELLINGKKRRKKVIVHLLRLHKKFGNTTQEVTEVRLGNMY